MADYEFPPDLLKLKCDFLAAEAECEKIGKRIPSPAAVLASEANPEPELEAELKAARARRLDIALQIRRHEWLRTAKNQYEADMALLKAAKARLAERPQGAA